MNPQRLEDARKILGGIKRLATNTPAVDVVVCPPFTYISVLAKSSAPVSVGAQDVFWEESGSYTGEVSAAMLKDSGAAYVIVGHSERRAMGETDEMVSKKVDAVLKAEMKAVVCVGEKERDPHGDYLAFLKNQITESLSHVSKKMMSNIVIAYEPIWAIGKSYSNAMTGKDMQEISIFIKKILTDTFGKDEVVKTPVLYGGSVAPINAQDIIDHGAIDGFLVGRQSLEAKSFGEIITIVAQAK